MRKVWIVIAIIVILLGIGAYFLFSGGGNAGTSSNSYQAPTTSSNTAASQYSGLDLTPGQQQTDVTPEATTDIPAP